VDGGGVDDLFGVPAQEPRRDGQFQL
jgi:hypothetical protein